jgi:hypothetical protein
MLEIQATLSCCLIKVGLLLLLPLAAAFASPAAAAFASAGCCLLLT